MPSPGASTDVLVVGAGPTGLVLALWLKRLGVGVRIVERATEPGTTSRALAVQARTLELYRQVGLADEAVKRGLRFNAVNLWVAGKHEARVSFGEIGKGLSPFPHLLVFPQEQHEQLLLEWLRAAGVEVERRVQLVSFEETQDRVQARLERDDGVSSTCEAVYIAGCDGARSRVREVLGIGFPGGTYDHLFYVADVEMEGAVANQELHLALAAADFLFVFPRKGEHMARLVGTVKRGSNQPEEGLTWDDVSQSVLRELKLKVTRVHWFSTYRVHHRVADHFGRGRAFLLGDAAHIHSPVGGQGMNTGIGDAINLAWKLAAVLQHRATPHLLDSFEPERIAFARRLVATTDRVFAAVTKDTAFSRFVRLRLAPRVPTSLLERPGVRRLMFKTISQILVNYRLGPLSEGRVGSVRGGDRLPWVEPSPGSTTDNFSPLTSLSWQMHVYGSASPQLLTECAERALPVHSFPWEPATKRAGLRQHAAYLVRPDGYVALAGADAESLQRYVDAHGLRFGAEG